MSYNNYGDYADPWPRDAAHRHPHQQAIGSDGDARQDDRGQGAARSTAAWNQEQYDPEVESWQAQPAESIPWSASSRIDYQHQSRPVRYEPYQVPHHSHPPPPRHSQHSHSQGPQEPIQFPNFELANSSFLLSDSAASAHEWEPPVAPERRDSNSTRSAASAENNDMPVASSSGFYPQNYESLPTFASNDPRRPATGGEPEKSSDKKLVKKADKSCRKCR